MLPLIVGLFCWNLFNALAIFFALRLLLPREQWAVAQVLVFLPALRSMQSAQSNALVAALIILAFVSFERGWLWRGAMAVAFGTVIKIFPLAAITFALPRPDRGRAMLKTVIAAAILIALPLVVISPSGLAAQYSSWNALERVESTLVGESAMRLLRDAGYRAPAWPLQLIAAATVLFVLFLRFRDWNDRHLRLRFLGFLMLFCVVFNHRAERQSMVIAVCGLVIWYLASPRSAWHTVWFAIVYVLVVMTGSELFPDTLKQLLSAPERFSIPLTLSWLLMLGELTLTRAPRAAIAEAG